MKDITCVGEKFKSYGIDVTCYDFVSVVRTMYKDTSKIDFDSMCIDDLDDIVKYSDMFNLDTTFDGVLNLKLALERFDATDYYIELHDIFDMIQENIELGVKRRVA